MTNIKNWGKDHWSTFAYIETRIVDYNGFLNKCHMRNDNDLHPAFAHVTIGYKKYPTKLKGGVLLENHDDWSCADDAEEAGLLNNVGTGVNRQYVLTELGTKVAQELRKHKANGGQFAEFVYEN